MEVASLAVMNQRTLTKITLIWTPLSDDSGDNSSDSDVVFSVGFVHTSSAKKRKVGDDSFDVEGGEENATQGGPGESESSDDERSEQIRAGPRRSNVDQQATGPRGPW